MNIKDIVNKIKLYLAEEVKLADVKTVDGQILHVDEDMISVGLNIFILAEDGTKNVPDDGEYKIEDGTTIIVADGQISEIKPAEAPVEDAVVEPVEAPVEAAIIEEPAIEPVVEIEPVEEEDKIAKMEADIKMLFELIQGIAENMQVTKVEEEMKVEMKKVSKPVKLEQKYNYTIEDKILNLMYNSKK